MTSEAAARTGQPIRHHYGSAPRHFGDLRVPPGRGPHPVVILIHGGFWRSHRQLDLMNPLAEDLLERGIASWNIEYRRVANVEAGTPGDEGAGFPGTLLDVARAADDLYTLAPMYRLDLGRVVTVGHSAGGHLALWLAARRHLPDRALETDEAVAGGSPAASDPLPPCPLAGVVSLAGVNDLADAWQRNLGGGAVESFLGGNPETVPEHFAAACPARLLPLNVPVVLIHGTADEHVPVEISRGYAEAARQAGDDVRLHEFEGLDHFAVIDPAAPPWATTIKEITGIFETPGGR